MLRVQFKSILADSISFFAALRLIYGGVCLVVDEGIGEVARIAVNIRNRLIAGYCKTADDAS